MPRQDAEEGGEDSSPGQTKKGSGTANKVINIQKEDKTLPETV